MPSTFEMPQHEIRLFVFDMAGTTVNEQNVVYKTLRAAVNHLGYDFSLATVLLIGAGKEKFQAIGDLLAQVCKEEAEHLKKSKLAYQYFLDHLKEAYERMEVTPYPGTTEVFDHLRQREVGIALNTGYNRTTTSLLLDKMGWREGREFHLLVTADDVPRSRPAPDMIRLAMERMGIADARQVAKVGDSIIDIEEGKAAGCGLTLGVTTGAHTAEQLESAGPDFVIDSLSEIVEQPFLRKYFS